MTTVAAPPTDHNKLMEKWSGWLDRMNTELTWGFLHQQLWTAMRDAILSQHRHAHASFLRSYTKVYTDSQIMLVSRITDTNETSESLGRLVSALIANPHVITRSSYIERWELGVDWDHGAREAAADEFVRMFGSTNGAEHLNTDQLLNHRSRLETDFETVRTFRDRVVAHLDPEDRKPMPALTFDDLSRTLDDLSVLLNHYNVLVKRFTHAHRLVTVQGDWREPFREPLFPPT